MLPTFIDEVSDPAGLLEPSRVRITPIPPPTRSHFHGFPYPDTTVASEPSAPPVPWAVTFSRRSVNVAWPTLTSVREVIVTIWLPPESR